MKKKTFIVQLLDSKNPSKKSFTQVEDALFYSNDTDASLVFIPHEDNFDFESAKVVMFNLSDESLVERDSVVTTENGRKVASYELPEEIISHWGEWVAQPVFISGGEIYSGAIVSFSVGRHLMQDRPPTLRDVIKVDELYSQLVTVMDEIAGKDVISAPEIILARRGYETLTESLNNLDLSMVKSDSSKLPSSLIDDELVGGMASATQEIEDARTDRSGKEYDSIALRLLDVDKNVSDSSDKIIQVENKYTAINNSMSAKELDIRDFGAVADANYYNSKNDTWYKHATFTGFLGSNPAGLDVENLYFNPDNFNYYQSASFSNPATDNSQALQNAINVAAQKGNPKRIFIPEGRYLINSRIYVDFSNMTIYGNGPTSELIAGSGVDTYLFYSHSDDRTYENRNLTNLVFENFCINGNRKQLTGIFIRMFTRGCIIERMKIHNFMVSQVELCYSWSFSLINNVFNGVRSHSGTSWVYSGNGLHIGYQGTVNIPTIIGNTFQFLHFGLNWKYGIGGVITGNDFENINGRWMVLEGVKGVSVTGNYFEALGNTNNTRGVVLGWPNSDYRVDSLVFTGNIFNPLKAGQSYFLIQFIANSKITNNYYGSGTDGFDMVFSSGLLDTFVHGNEFSYRTGEAYGLNNINAEKNKLIELQLVDQDIFES